MTDISPTDLAPLDGFLLCWRWTQCTHGALSLAALATMRPLSAEKAAELAPAAAERCAERSATGLELSISAERDDAEHGRARLVLPSLPARRRSETPSED